LVVLVSQLVVESPVPVLLDVYADWCGPCKQLAPMLEDIAVRAGGMLRLVKVNSDKNRGVADALKVTALPSVFAFRGGRLVDKFVGIPPQGELQQLLMGLLMGAAPKADKDKDLGVLGNAFNHLAGGDIALLPLSHQSVSPAALARRAVDCSRDAGRC
jgi:thioredoxin